MVFQKLDDILPPERTKKLLMFSLILAVITYSLMIIFFLLSGSSTNMFQSQLSFSGEFMKAQYAGTNDLDMYRIAETIDFVFMVAYGSLIISLALRIARNFEEDSIWRKSGYSLVPVGVVTACLDVVENSFIMAMLSNPISFPNEWAITHSSFALVKWILLLILILWALTAGIVNKLKK